MPDKKPLTFCIDWMRSRAEHTPMPASRATMESIVAWLEELEGLKETPDPKSDIQTAVCTGQNCPMQASTADPANCACVETCRWATRPRTNGDVAPVVHGRWISWEKAENFVPSPDRHECSVCHDAAQVLVNGFELLSDYCPNCGAKMDEEETER